MFAILYHLQKMLKLLSLKVRKLQANEIVCKVMSFAILFSGEEEGVHDVNN